MNIVKILDNIIESGRRKIKVLRNGTSDVRKPYESMPFGLDSSPIDGVKGVYSTTSTNGQQVILGYINTNQKAAKGEFRTFAVDSDGNEVAYTWIKSDGTLELLSDVDNAVRYSELETAFNQLKSDFDDLVSKYNAHIHVTTATIGASPTVGTISPTTSTDSPSTADITPSKIEEIKVP